MDLLGDAASLGQNFSRSELPQGETSRADGSSLKLVPEAAAGLELMQNVRTVNLMNCVQCPVEWNPDASSGLAQNGSVPSTGRAQTVGVSSLLKTAFKVRTCQFSDLCSVCDTAINPSPIEGPDRDMPESSAHVMCVVVVIGKDMECERKGVSGPFRKKIKQRPLVHAFCCMMSCCLC